jgi:hypothetical protein
MNLFDAMRSAANRIEDGIDKVDEEHVYETRLAILCGAGKPSAEYETMARAEAKDHAEKLRQTNETKN